MSMFYPAIIGFALSLLALVGLMVQLMRGRPWGLRARAMTFAVAVSAVWSVLGLAFVVDASPVTWAAFRWGDLMQAASWIGFVLVLLYERQPGETAQARPGRYIIGASTLMVAAVVVGGLAPPAQLALGTTWVPSASKVSLVASLCLAILGLVCLEQLLRNVPAQQRWDVTPLAIALGGIFAFDLYLYSDAVLLGNLDPVIWSAQGSVSACAAPLLAVATARNQKWTRNLAVSHRLVFHSTVLLAAAGYLLGVAALGYLVRYVGGSWGPALQVVLLVAALMVLGALLTLGTLRSKLRVLIHKNLFKQRYDYREEWLRFTRLIAARDAASDIYVRCINALADLVESPAGSVWVRRGNVCRQVAQWNTPRVSALEPIEGPLVAFLNRTGWVINLDEYRRAPVQYGALQLPDWLAQSTSAWLVVPLVAAEGVIGFVVLMTSRVRVELDWEILDLLKTAGSQVAALLGQIRGQRRPVGVREVRRLQSFVGIRGARSEEPGCTTVADAQERSAAWCQSGLPARHAGHRAACRRPHERHVGPGATRRPAGREPAGLRSSLASSSGSASSRVRSDPDSSAARASRSPRSGTRIASNTCWPMWCRTRSMRPMPRAAFGCRWSVTVRTP